MGHRFRGNEKLKYKFLEDDIKETNNNGLEYTVAVLENLYTDPDFPPKAQKLEADCVSEYDGEWEQYKTDRPETHPNPEGNGDSTLDFFRDQFSFSGRETAAIMGAHTLGRMHKTLAVQVHLDG